MELYFAFGSNLDINQMESRCTNVKFLSVGYLPGHRLAFTQYYEPSGGGVADIVEDENATVWGKIYELPMEALERLDAYEGHPTDYRRRQHYITTSDGHQHLAWVYSVVVKEAEFIPPSKRYMEIIKNAAKDAELPNEYIAFLNTIKTADT